MPARAAPTSFLSRVAQNLPAEVFSKLYTCLPYHEQLGLATVDKGLRKAVLDSMPRALFCITQSSSLESILELMPGLSELVLFVRTDKDYARLHRRKRRHERRALHAQHLMAYEQWQRDEKEDEEIDKKEEAEAAAEEEKAEAAAAEEDNQERRSLEEDLEKPQHPKFEMATLMAFSLLKRLTIIIECQFRPRLLGFRTLCCFPTLSSLELRMDRSVRVENESVMRTLGTLLSYLSCPALKVLDLEGVQSWELGSHLHHICIYPNRYSALESVSIRIRPEHLIEFLQDLRKHLLDHPGALPLPNLKKVSLTLHGDWTKRINMNHRLNPTTSQLNFLDECLAYPTACTRLFSVPFLQFTVTGNRREKQARDNVASFWSKTDEEGLKKQQLALLFDAYGQGDSPFVPQAVVDLLSNSKRTLPTLAILDGLEILLKECPSVGLEGILERIPVIADVVMSTLHTAAAAAPAVGMEEPALTLGRVVALVSIRRVDWLRGQKSFSLLFATALVERGLVKKLLEILAQGKDREGKETASSVMFLLRALPVEAFRPEGGGGGGGGGGRGGGGGGGIIFFVVCLVGFGVFWTGRREISGFGDFLGFLLFV